MTGRMYTVVISGVASPATAAWDLFELVCATAKPIRIRRLRIAQTSEPTTEEEQVPISIIRGYTTSGSGGSAATPVKLNSTAPDPGFTAETMNTTVASTGTPVTPVEDAFNTRAGFDLPFAPEEAPEAVNGERIVIRGGAHADAMTIYATVWVEELG